MPKTNTIRKCEVEACVNKHHARGLCSSHYAKLDFKKAWNKQYRQDNPDKLRTWRREQQKRYLKRYPEKVKDRAAKRRAFKAEGVKRFGWIDRRLIDNYYSRICGICGLKIESNYEIDHTIPLGRNGSHTVENLQLAHPICNRTKKDRLQKEMQLDTIILRELIND